ncbi:MULTISPECIES: DUF4232 domain-containing protein [unclassified Streptomyces]|uniref:DUF4232 domain-containing protein n=1 Tax=unclassified Streptomyces TaxID=2593676 RepID=UPI000DAD7F34|nr:MULTISPECIES: DUF4232 domain-containing protein [unclassified Streptomyces]PZT75083.1 hypothetical protein DNK55_23990 [Streptomyces sp. AC1-42T]PZT81934.1 hypothetical protein DNK56_07455 [Streptomyces sp. AC1-42W]
MRPAPVLALCAALASTALLTGCGKETAAKAAPAATCASLAPVPDPAGRTWDDVRVISGECGPSGAPSTGYEVTNNDDEPLTYTITFTLVNGFGEAMDSVTRTVEAVKPGQTVRRPLDTDEGPGSARGHRARITKVRAVPANGAPGGTDACPLSGVRVTNDEGNAAMGLRVVGIHLVNCSTADYRLNGYPALRLLGEDREPVTGVDILRGTDKISSGIGGDPSPRPVTLRPGESAYANLAWRNTTTAGDPVDAPYVEVTARPGAEPVTVTPELDLGTTGRLGVGPWTKTPEDRQPRPDQRPGASQE